jgi:hypothetical protein
LRIASAAAIAGGSTSLLAMLGPRLFRLAKGEVEHLQREVAVMIARQMLRKKLRIERPGAGPTRRCAAGLGA